MGQTDRKPVEPARTGAEVGTSAVDQGGALRSQDGLVGDSEPFRQLLRKLPRVASSEATLLITGETGSGKEAVARAVHVRSSRRNAAFIPVNCGALPDQLLEKELFGRARGAHAGGERSGRGLLAEAEGGTLFLDELDGLSLSAQARLLRFLQNREYRELGSARLVQADVRIIAASNLELSAEVTVGSFRADLYHRLHVLSVEVPPLRARRDDIPLLAQHFAGVFGGLYGRDGVRFTEGALAILVRHEWPGNVRELRSLIERAVLLSTATELTEADVDLLPLEDGAALQNPGTTPRDTAGTGAEPGHESFRAAKDKAVRHFEHAYLVQVMAAVDGNVSRAARLAGMQRRDFQRLLRKHDVRRTSRKPVPPLPE
jgi:two-component system response regulator GlrR